MTNVHLLPRRLASYPTALDDVTEPFTPEVNIEHPAPDGGDPAGRSVIGRTTQMWLHAATDTWDHVPVAAVHWDGLGESVELGPWHLSTDDALVLADHLHRLVTQARTLMHEHCNCAELIPQPLTGPGEHVW